MLYRSLKIWLVSLCFMVFLMVVVGGVTRLTHSGLSMVEWKPLIGWIPPISEADWQTEFDKYKQFPEYKYVNKNMQLAEFKWIFFWEYLHRVLGRLFGLVFLIPLLYFSFQKSLTKKLKLQLWLGFVLGGLQGLMGWYMVKSGLVDVPQVSHYRLAAHLGLAFFIFAYLFWILLGLHWQTKATRIISKEEIRKRFLKMAYGILALLSLQIIFGAFTAGSRAGFAYDTFPLLDGALVPESLWQLDPWWLNFFETLIGIQFIHRLLAFVLLISIPVFCWKLWKKLHDDEIKKAVQILLFILVLQFVLGVATVVLHVPIGLAAFHQIGAFFLLMFFLVILKFLHLRASD